MLLDKKESLYESFRRKGEFMRIIGVMRVEIGDIREHVSVEDTSFSFVASLVQARAAQNVDAISFCTEVLFEQRKFIASATETLTSHFASFSDDLTNIIESTIDLVHVVKENSNVLESMRDVTHAFSEINYFVVKGYEYIDLLDDVPYYFQSQDDGESSLTDLDNCKKRFERAYQSLHRSELLYNTLKRYCVDAQKSCNIAARELGQESMRVKPGSMASIVHSGGSAGQSIINVLTLGITPIVRMVVSAARSRDIGYGTGGGDLSNSHFNISFRTVDRFKQLFKIFSQIIEHSTQLYHAAKEMREAFKVINHHLEYQDIETFMLLKENGKKPYLVTKEAPKDKLFIS